MIKKILYRIFIHNFRLKIIAFVLAVILWILARGKV